MKLIRQLLIMSLIAHLPAMAASGPAAAAATKQASVVLPAVAEVDPAPPGEIRHIPLTKLGSPTVLLLRPVSAANTLTFGARKDELITKAVLRLHYSYSPALIPGLSHIKLMLNGEFLGLVPVTKDNGGRQLHFDIDIDPRLIIDFNRLTLQFIGHYSWECEDPFHNSLWADVSGSSEIEMTVQPLALKSELAILPEPFFDKRDYKRLDLPFVFSGQPAHATLRAAAVTASWFGKLAAWRGARFPAHLGELPKGHAIVFATNAERPAFLRAMAPVAAPTLAVMTNPADGYSKLLLVLGRDGADLKSAVDALVLGNAVLSGTQVQVSTSSELTPRQAYDAPNWVRLDRPTKFGELLETTNQLQVFGHEVEPVQLNVRIPADLFTWRSRGVPVELKYRYTPPVRINESRLSMSINGELVQAFNLRASGKGDDANRMRLPLLDDALFGESKEVLIPSFKLGSRNQLQYRFSFSYVKEGNCKDTHVENVRAMIDSDSTIDFSGYPNYAVLPHLGYFATSGYPFTKYADLSQTAVVLPEQPKGRDIETMLALLGRMGESTGYPATQVRVVAPRDVSALNDLDLLLIGTSPAQSLLDRWSGQLPASITGPVRTISQPVLSVSSLYDWLGFGSEPDPTVAAQERVAGAGPLAALFGFESPLSAGRSVVAVTAVQADDLGLALDALDNPGLVKSMHGSAVFIGAQKVESVLAGKTYAVGSLPFWTMIWYPLSQHPVLLACLAFLAILIVGFALWRALKAVRTRRLHGTNT